MKTCLIVFCQNLVLPLGVLGVLFLNISVHIGALFFAYKQIMNVFANRGMPFVIVENTQLQTWALRRQNVATATLE